MTDGSISDWSRWWTRGSRPGLGLTDPAHPTNIIRKIFQNNSEKTYYTESESQTEREREKGSVRKRQTDRQTDRVKGRECVKERKRR